jgi:hypothetical protein
MTDSIDLTKINIMTDSMYDTTGTQMSEPKRTMVYTTPFEQQPKYNMRAGNKPFQASKYPSAGYEWYAKRAVNDVDLQADMDKVLPDQQVQNWSRVKTVILQKDDAKSKSKETDVPSQLWNTKNKEIQEKLKRIRKRDLHRAKEGYITSPFGDYEDTWSSAGRIKEQHEEKFTVAGKEFEVIDVVIVILAIIIIVIAIYMYINKNKNGSTQSTPTITQTVNNDLYDFYKTTSPIDYNTHSTTPASNRFNDEEYNHFNEYANTAKENNITKDNFDKKYEKDKKYMTDLKTKYDDGYRGASNDIKVDGGEARTLNCGNLCGGAAFDTRL